MSEAPDQGLGPEIPNPAERGRASRDGLAGAVRRGVAWGVATKVFEQVLQLSATAVLARLLLPEQYGLAALVAVVTGFAAIFVDLGIPGAVIQARRLTVRLLSTAFWLNLGMGLFMAGLVCLAARPVAAFFDEPALAGLMVVASLTFVLSLNAVHVALMQRALHFQRIARMTFASVTAGVLATLLAAFLGAGAYSLVIGPVFQRLVSVVQVQLAVRWWPAGRPHLAAARELWAFGGGLTGFNMVTYWAASADRLVLGRFVDVASVGYYTRATNLMMMPVAQTAGVLSRVFFPAFAAMSDDLPRLRRAWLRLVRASFLLGLPLGVGVAAAAPAAVETLYGATWLPVVPLLVVLSATIPFLLVGATSGPLYQALGKTGLQFRISLVNSTIAVVLIVVGAQWGALGVAAAVAGRSPLTLSITLAPLLRAVHLRVRDLLVPLWRTALAATVMGGATWGAGAVLAQWSAPLVLLVQVLVGVTTYALVIAPLERSLVRELLGSRLGRRGGGCRQGFSPAEPPGPARPGADDAARATERALAPR